MLATAGIHLALIPSHLTEDRVRAFLFAADAVAFIVVSVLALTVTRWRGIAVLLTVATILTYFVYIVTGREGLDVVGVLTKTIEVAAVVVIVIQRTHLDVSRPAQAREAWLRS